MSEPDERTSVAQTILNRLEDRYKGALPHNVDRFDGQLHGAAMMHETLSAEARAILSCWEPEDDEYQLLRDTFGPEHLGLTLEEDTK